MIGTSWFSFVAAICPARHCPSTSSLSLPASPRYLCRSTLQIPRIFVRLIALHAPTSTKLVYHTSSDSGCRMKHVGNHESVSHHGCLLLVFSAISTFVMIALVINGWPENPISKHSHNIHCSRIIVINHCQTCLYSLTFWTVTSGC